MAVRSAPPPSKLSLPRARVAFLSTGGGVRDARRVALAAPALCSRRASPHTWGGDAGGGRSALNRGLELHNVNDNLRRPRRRSFRTTAPRMMFDQLSERFGDTLRRLQGNDKITEKNIDGALKDIRRAMLDADVNLKVVNALLKRVKQRALGEDVLRGVKPGEQLVKVMYDELTAVMGEKQSALARSGRGPTVVLLAGLQGAGKTTAAAKLALYCQRQHERAADGGDGDGAAKSNAKAPQKVLLVAADVYRPAAIEQLKRLGEQTSTEVFSMDGERSPVRISREAVAHARLQRFDTVIVDTAGRQVIDERLMAELREMKDAVSPDEVLLVVDAMTGQEAANVTRAFNDAVGLTGAILTKLDGDTRGGAALSVKHVSQRPIKFIGVGEKVEKLDVFYPERMASRILGMGDVLSLVEKAQERMNEREAEQMTRKMMDKSFDFDDFIKQAKMVSSMGSLGGMLKMMPGVPKMKQEELREAEKRLKRSTVLIQSMTRRERHTPELLTRDRSALSRLRRIAKGSGSTMDQARSLVSDFERMRSMMQRMSNQMMESGEDGALRQREQYSGVPGGGGGGGGGGGAGNRKARRGKAAKKGADSASSGRAARGFGGFGRK